MHNNPYNQDVVMSENFTSDKIKNNEFNLNTDESDYTYLNIRLEEIKTTIALLEKTIFK
jgi:hypothetical protein